MGTQERLGKNAYGMGSLFQAYKKAPSESLRNQITLGYLHIARTIAARFSGKGVEYDDLLQVASMALIDAVERFDPDMGVQFQTYATPVMVGKVKNYFRDKLHLLNLPRKAALLKRQIDQARAELSQSLMRSPTLMELCERLDLPEEEVSYALAMQGAMYPASLDEEINEDADSPFSAFLGAEEGGYAQFEIRETVENLLSRLDRASQRVLTERYFHERSQREVASLMGVSQMTVSRIERKALCQIREWL